MFNVYEMKQNLFVFACICHLGWSFLSDESMLSWNDDAFFGRSLGPISEISTEEQDCYAMAQACDQLINPIVLNSSNISTSVKANDCAFQDLYIDNYSEVAKCYAKHSDCHVHNSYLHGLFSISASYIQSRPALCAKDECNKFCGATMQQVYDSVTFPILQSEECTNLMNQCMEKATTYDEYLKGQQQAGICRRSKSALETNGLEAYSCLTTENVLQKCIYTSTLTTHTPSVYALLNLFIVRNLKPQEPCYLAPPNCKSDCETYVESLTSSYRNRSLHFAEIKFDKLRMKLKDEVTDECFQAFHECKALLNPIYAYVKGDVCGFLGSLKESNAHLMLKCFDAEDFQKRCSDDAKKLLLQESISGYKQKCGDAFPCKSECNFLNKFVANLLNETYIPDFGTAKPTASETDAPTTSGTKVPAITKSPSSSDTNSSSSSTTTEPGVLYCIMLLCLVLSSL